MKKYIISIDPATTTGLCVAECSSQFDVVYTTYFDYTIILFLPFFEKLLERYPAKTLVIEDQYFYKNPSTLIKLTEIRVEMSTIAHLYGLDVVKVAPSKWQSMLSVGAKAKRSVRKTSSKLFATALTNEEVKNDNVADAVCIGYYWYTKLLNGS